MATVEIFTALLNERFVEGMNVGAPAELPKVDKIMEIVPSTQRIETYPFNGAVPGIQRYAGHRRLGQVSPSKFSVENLEYDASFQVMIRDIEDDQAGVFAKAATNLGAKAASYSKRAILNTLSQAKTATCFDGSSACASSHNVGTGNNVLTQDNASNDGKTFKIAALVCNDGMKPLLWQDRKAPKLNDDWSDKISSFRKAVNYWVDLEGASLFGAWWNVCWMDMTDTPTLAETQVAIQAFVTAFRGFYLPANLPGDPIEYMHEQLEPSVNSLMFVVDPRLEQLFRTVLTAETLTLTGGPATNIYRGWGDLIISNYMN